MVTNILEEPVTFIFRAELKRYSEDGSDRFFKIEDIDNHISR
jgi:hypothetical protein